MSQSNKPVIYIASPYTKGDPAINTHCQLRAFDDLMNDGLVWPVIPLLSHFQHIFMPRDYRDWINYDLALIDRYDACLRLNAEYDRLDYLQVESSGADGEVARFKAQGKPVFYDKAALYDWVRKPERQIIGLAGHSGVGKDTAAQGLTDAGWTRVAFADGVREALLALNPYFKCQDGFEAIDVEVDVVGWARAKEYSDIRRLLQRMGTEAGRNIHGDDCWIKLAKRKIDAAPRNVVITDVRFANEAAAIRSWGGKVIRIDRPGVGPVNGHVSEALCFPVDCTIGNFGTVEELQSALRKEAGVENEWAEPTLASERRGALA